MRSGRLSLVVLASTFAAACGVFGSSDDPAPPDAPPDRSGENAQPPVTGEPLKGVFVSSSQGADTNDGGGDDRPVKSLAMAMKLAQARQVRVLACAEEYQEALVVVDGVSVYGNVDCKGSPWVQKDGAHATVRAPSTPGLVANGITKPTRIEAVDVLAADATKGATSAGTSYGALVKDSTNLTLAKATITAGNGSDGDDGAEPPASAQVATGDADARASTNQFFCTNGTFVVPCNQVKVHSGTPGGTRTCSAGPQPGPGGRGGDGRVYNAQQPVNDPNVLGGDGLIEQGSPATATAQTNQGGQTEGAIGLRGKDGANGDNGKNGSWTFGAEGFLPGDGTPGQLGGAGQGGGGGAGRESWCFSVGNCSVPPSNPQNPVALAANGAGGGAGGCAGVAGTPGKGGGASVALFSWKSTVTLDDVTLVAKVGGRAGKGTLGLVGGAGGKGGAASQYTFGGADGGNGGNAGLSGHGAPGPSIALAFTEPAPVRVKNVVLTPGRAGEGQPELSRGTQSIPASVSDAYKEWPVTP